MLLFSLRVIMNKNFNSHKAIPWFKTERNACYTLNLSSRASLINSLNTKAPII